MKSWKTGLAGILVIALMVAHQFYPAIFTEAIVGSITSLLVAVGLIAAKDANVTGGNVSNGDTPKP